MAGSSEQACDLGQCRLTQADGHLHARVAWRGGEVVGVFLEVGQAAGCDIEPFEGLDDPGLISRQRPISAWPVLQVQCQW